MREASEVATSAEVAAVKSLFDTHVNDGKVVLIVEGPDDKEVYEKSDGCFFGLHICGL